MSSIKDHDEIIKKSYERSIRYGVQKEQILPKRVLSGEEILLNIKKNSTLIKTASTFIDIIYGFLTGSGFFYCFN